MVRNCLSAAALLGVGFMLGCAHHSAVSVAAARPALPPPLKEIHVDRSCRILLDGSNALAKSTEANPLDEQAICHLESVLTSHHVEEALSGGVQQRSMVTIAEQDYLLQNVTPAPVMFVVEHALPSGWNVDSDPQPVKIAGNTAFFRVNAEPGQVVRLHVGTRHTVPIANVD